MNKPAAKEPSMDEILSSIRQIIADDDGEAAPRRPSAAAVPDPMEAAFAGAPSEPLALSSAQIVESDDEEEDMGFEALLADATQAVKIEDEPAKLVDPEDVSFAPAEVELPSFSPADIEPEEPAFAPAAEAIAEPSISEEPLNTMSAFESKPDPVVPFRPSVAEAAPMPDATLSAQIAEGLLEPATQSAVRSSIGKLNAAGIGVAPQVGLGTPGVTIESMIREMLRPMLKEWLDENLPSVVERMVEKEISRVSRGE
jgi:uncharacterized protein